MPTAKPANIISRISSGNELNVASMNSMNKMYKPKESNYSIKVIRA